MDERKVEDAPTPLQATDKGAATSAEHAGVAAQETTRAAPVTSEAVEAPSETPTATAAAAAAQDGAERRTGPVGDHASSAAERASAPRAPPGPVRPSGGVWARALLWVMLALPLLWLLARWAGGAVTYGEVVSRSGFWAALLLVPTTLVTPLGHLFPRARPLAWLRGRRHDLGAACVAHALVHTAAYAIGKGSLGLILREAQQPWLLVGWATLAIFLIFAATRAGATPRDPRPPWTRRHRIIYAGAALVVLHWALSAFDPLTVQLQTALRAYGYYAGPIDGIIGLQSRDALRSLQRDYGLEVTGGITSEVLDVLGIIPN